MLLVIERDIGWRQKWYRLVKIKRCRPQALKLVGSIGGSNTDATMDLNVCGGKRAHRDKRRGRKTAVPTEHIRFDDFFYCVTATIIQAHRPLATKSSCSAWIVSLLRRQSLCGTTTVCVEYCEAEGQAGEEDAGGWLQGIVGNIWAKESPNAKPAEAGASRWLHYLHQPGYKNGNPYCYTKQVPESQCGEAFHNDKLHASAIYARQIMPSKETARFRSFSQWTTVGELPDRQSKQQGRKA